MESGNRYSIDGAASPCVEGCGFYGSPENQNRCSKCHKEFLLKHQRPEVSSPDTCNKPKAAAAASPSGPDHGEAAEDEELEEGELEEKKKRRSNRCERCNKKVGLLGFECRCGMLLCGSHRYPAEHSCTFDFKALDIRALVQNNPLVRRDKLDSRV